MVKEKKEETVMLTTKKEIFWTVTHLIIALLITPIYAVYHILYGMMLMIPMLNILLLVAEKDSLHKYKEGRRKEHYFCEIFNMEEIVDGLVQEYVIKEKVVTKIKKLERVKK